jgi:hypothetical protein
MGLTDIPTLILRTGGDVLTCILTSRGHVNSGFNEVWLHHVHLWTQATWPDHSMRDSVVLQRPGMDAGVESSWPFVLMLSQRL